MRNLLIPLILLIALAAGCASDPSSFDQSEKEAAQATKELSAANRQLAVAKCHLIAAREETTWTLNGFVKLERAANAQECGAPLIGLLHDDIVAAS